MKVETALTDGNDSGVLKERAQRLKDPASILTCAFTRMVGMDPRRTKDPNSVGNGAQYTGILKVRRHRDDLNHPCCLSPLQYTVEVTLVLLVRKVAVRIDQLDRFQNRAP